MEIEYKREDILTIVKAIKNCETSKDLFVFFANGAYLANPVINDCAKKQMPCVFPPDHIYAFYFSDVKFILECIIEENNKEPFEIMLDDKDYQRIASTYHWLLDTHYQIADMLKEYTTYGAPFPNIKEVVDKVVKNRDFYIDNVGYDKEDNVEN